jgi:hypothetical protein
MIPEIGFDPMATKTGSSMGTVLCVGVSRASTIFLSKKQSENFAGRRVSALLITLPCPTLACNTPIRVCLIEHHTHFERNLFVSPIPLSLRLLMTMTNFWTTGPNRNASRSILRLVQAAPSSDPQIGRSIDPPRILIRTRDPYPFAGNFFILQQEFASRFKDSPERFSQSTKVSGFYFGNGAALGSSGSPCRHGDQRNQYSGTVVPNR